MVDEASEPATPRIALAYWTTFAAYLREKEATFQIGRPQPLLWNLFPIGRRGCGINATININRQRIGVGLHVIDDVEKKIFHELLAQKESIEEEFGEPLDWGLPERKATLTPRLTLGI